MKIDIWDTAYNILKGKVKRVDINAEEPEVILEIAPGVEISSFVSRDLAWMLSKSVGKETYFTIDASDIIIAVD
jgi:molybdopterin-binding protein